jgi:hypothetical protein
MRGEALGLVVAVLGACSPDPPPASCKTSCQEGTTQCHDAQLLGTCTHLADGCYAYVSVPCPEGQYCDDALNRCQVGDVCSPASTLSACTRAAMNLAACCNYRPDPWDLCETELQLGQDPLAACTHLHSIDCPAMHAELLPGCCCPPNTYCDPDSQVCLQECVRGSDCPEGQSCAPAYPGAGPPKAGAPYVCGPFQDCEKWACPYGGCCVGDLSGNRFCAMPCADSSTCSGGNCDTYAYVEPSCSSVKACGP